ncbi:PAS domain S-box protein [Roseateles sp. DAIF2]|uniref:ATP-binding protein n=1 Tax=Roseateles sp. DAIF2 TaxID=2714952 RepID=UPI0018A2FDEE|nr:ATP-binding protein [Roseateles sp. DAIF2]QPF74063.1 PAS domain S-box protein [Roseateles sp. DAIF2]
MPLSVRQSSRLARSVRLASAALVLACITSLLTLAWFERREALQNSRERLELLARVLEDHATRSVDSAGLVLRTLADGISLPPHTDAALLQPQLSQALLAQPILRGVAVLDMQGRILASSDPREQGLRIDPKLLGALPPAGSEQLLPWLPGRSLRTLGDPALGTAVGMLPLVRRVMGPAGQEFLLLALINPDALANYQQMAIGNDEGERAALASHAGQLLAGTEGVPLAPASALNGHPVFRDLLRRQDHASYLGDGLAPGAQVAAYRVSRTRPLVVLVEQDEQAALQDWRDGLWLLGAGGALILSLLAGAAHALLRSLRVRERARHELDRAHEQVALREREMSVLLKSVQELIFRTDAQGRLTFVNARWGTLSRERAEEAIGQALQDLVEPQDRERVAQLFAADDRAGVRSAEVSLRTGEGLVRRLQVAVVPLQGLGHALGFAGSAMDVTERHEAEQRLQRQLGFTELLLEVSPQPISMVDPGGRYVSVNRAWEEFTGRSRNKVLGQQVGFFMPTAERAIHATQDAQLRQRGGRLSYEARLLGRDGRPRDMLVTKVVVPDPQGGGMGILSTLTDVSEFRAAERATREGRDAAEEASRAKSEFIANISHELRTPLQSILGFSELGVARGRDTPKLAAMFGDIHASGQRMLALVNDLLDVSKIESAVGTFDLERCDLRQLIESVARELDPLLARRSLAVRSHLPVSPLVAKVDPLRFQQVIRNVMANAIKFSPEGGVIELAARLTPQNEIHVSIADRGPGIPPAELDKIFEAFIQSSNTKDGSGGTGLGLAICRKIIEIHGGRIHAENRDGGGTCFHIYLPPRPSGDTQLSTVI